MKNLSETRIQELLEAEYKLNLLEAGGVSNWDWYSESLEPFFKEKQKEEKLNEIVDNICEIICTEIDEPAGSGCGYGIRESGQIELLNYLKTLNIGDIK